MRRLIGNSRFSAAVLLAMALAGGIRAATAEDAVSLKVHNETSQAIEVYVASEKSRAEKPWTHLQINAEGDGQCALDLPDRYVVIVQAGDQWWRSKRFDLKGFLAAHPGYLLRISGHGSQSIAGHVEPGPDAQAAAADP